MDYEKEYNEVFQRAKELHEGGNALTKQQMEIIFPQLAEGEDERIRKLLVWQVHRNIEDETNDLAGSVYDGVKGHDPDLEESIEDWKKCLAWLEKQKINTEGDFGRGYDCGYEACLNSHGVEWFEKQKEQKPAELETLGKPMTHEEWAEDYWEHHKFASPNGNDKCDVIQFEHKGFIDFCMAYCVDQKPQDRLVLHDTFGYEKGRQVGQREGVEMVLKTPESYGLYKPAQWSEEDERIRLSCIKTIDAVIDDERERWEDYNPGKPYRPIMSYDEQIDWLKSIRPSWKPSEEQMKALSWAINYLTDIEQECASTLALLKFNLKELM